MDTILSIRIEQGEEIHMGDTCRGNMLFSPTIGGSFTGFAKGRVEPIGMMNTNAVEPCHHNQSVEVILTDEDGAHIMVHMEAFLDWNEEIERKIVEEGVDLQEFIEKGECYASGTVTMVTDSHKYRHLERKIFPCHFDQNGWSVYIINVMEAI